jgi:hypothetical protein
VAKGAVPPMTSVLAVTAVTLPGHLGLDGLGYARYLRICQKDIFFISVRDIKNLIFLSNSA